MSFGGDEDKSPNLYHSLSYKRGFRSSLEKKKNGGFWIRDTLSKIERMGRKALLERFLTWKLTWKTYLVTCHDKLCKYNLISFFLSFIYITFFFSFDSLRIYIYWVWILEATHWVAGYLFMIYGSFSSLIFLILLDCLRDC